MHICSANKSAKTHQPHSTAHSLHWVGKSESSHAVYALCRWVDDIVDGDEEPTVEISDELTEQTNQRDLMLRELHSGSEPSTRKNPHPEAYGSSFN